MFNFIENFSEYTLEERNVCYLTILKSDETLTLSTKGSFWIMSNGGNAVLDNKLSTGKDTWVSMGHQSIEVQGPALVIDNPGFQCPERKFCSFDPNSVGQLSYIDGCSNSNLIDPPRNGDPCLNYLYFPPGIDQSWHTHPSVRIGYVLTGKGYACIQSNGVSKEHLLEPGKIFVLDRFTKHRFRTESDQHMTLMIYHPDSEDGPRDENNPMKSRTYLR